MAGPKKPTHVAAPTNSLAGDLAKTLDAINKASKKRSKATGIRRASKNPAVAGVDKTLQVAQASRGRMPTAAELLRDTAVTIGDSGRVEAMPRAGNAYDDIVLGESQVLASGQIMGPDGELIPDRTEYLSPPPSIDPDRPRAREAKYNPDTRQLHVVFRNGGTYVYYDVPTTVWRALKRNRSFGQTLDRLVLNQYAYEKVAF